MSALLSLSVSGLRVHANVVAKEVLLDRARQQARVKEGGWARDEESWRFSHFAALLDSQNRVMLCAKNSRAGCAERGVLSMAQEHGINLERVHTFLTWGENAKGRLRIGLPCKQCAEAIASKTQRCRLVVSQRDGAITSMELTRVLLSAQPRKKEVGIKCS